MAPCATVLPKGVLLPDRGPPGRPARMSGPAFQADKRSRSPPTNPIRWLIAAPVRGP